MSEEFLEFETDTPVPASCDLRTAEEILRELRRRAGETERGRYAALALDELVARTSHESLVRPPPGEDAGGPARASPGGAWTHAGIEPLIVPLRELAPRSWDKAWCELALGVLDLVPVAMRKPSQVLQLALDAPAAARPVLLADYWHLLMAGARHDPAYILPIALDVWGEVLSSPPRVLAQTLAAAPRRGIGDSPWRPELSSRGLRASLEALAAVPDEFDFVRGWALVRLQPLLVENGLVDEALALAYNLSDRLDTRSDTLRRFREPKNVRPELCRDLAFPHPGVTPLSVSCDLGTHWRRFHVYVGRPAPGFHPLHFQAARIREADGGIVPTQTLARVRMALETPL